MTAHLQSLPRVGPRVPCEKPCPRCPFLRNSAPGWLGGYDGPAEFLKVHYTTEQTGPCHQTLDYTNPDWLELFVRGEMGRRCKGQADFFKNALKRPRNPDIVNGEKNLAIFQWPHEFLAHHGREV